MPRIYINAKQLGSVILRHGKASALLITNLTNIRYLTDLDLSAGTMLILPKRMILFADDRYFERALRTVREGVEVLHPLHIKPMIKALKRCGVEADHMSIDTYTRLKRKYRNTKFVQCVNLVEHFRRCKSAAELASIRKACRISELVLRLIPRYLKPGITELKLAWTIRSLAHEHGADDMAFETIVAFGENTSHPHHRPTAKKLIKGDLVQIDMGARVGGYCSDYSRVYFTGFKTARQRQVYRILSQVQRRAKQRVRAGITNHALDREARASLKQHGLDSVFCHALGHGLGLEIHEGIVLSHRAQKKVLLKNEVITIEPGLYFKGEWGMRIEDTVIVR